MSDPCHTTALCKWRGALVLMEITTSPQGKCPDCGANEFREYQGWLECNCGFAVLKSHVMEQNDE